MNKSLKKLFQPINKQTKELNPLKKPIWMKQFDKTKE